MPILQTETETRAKHSLQIQRPRTKHPESKLITTEALVELIENRTIIETTPDGVQRVFSDLEDPREANIEIAEFYRLSGNGMIRAGGGDTGPDPCSTTVREVAKRFSRQKVTDGDWADFNTRQNREFRLAYIVELLGPDKAFGSLKRADGRRVRDALVQRMGPGSDLDSADKLSAYTAKSYFQIFTGLALFAVAEEFADIDISMLLKLKVSKNKADSYVAFDQDDIRKLVNGPLYTGQDQPRAGEVLAAYFWVPLIGLYTGVRLNEICQLTVNDVKHRAGVWYFCLTAEEENQSVKNEASKRVVPIHSALIQAGLLTYLRERQRSDDDEGRLFADLPWDKKNKWGRKVGRWFNETYLKSLNLTQPRKKVFHSFRHSVVKNLRVKNVTDEQIAAIVGHEGKTTTSQYGSDVSDETLRWLQQLVERIDYGISMAHIDYSGFQEYAFCQGQPKKKAHLRRAFRARQAAKSGTSG